MELKNIAVFTFGMSVLLSLASCRSTSHLDPGNPLPGIALEASQETILFSWSDDIPLVHRLRPNTVVEVLAEYDTNYGKVTNEVLSRARVNAGINGLKLSLAEATKFEPSSPVCLRLAINRQPIPLRIATFGESSDGFHYSEWTTIASQRSQKQTQQTSLQRLDTNITNFSKADPNFSIWQRKNAIYDVEQCEQISIQEITERPSTALQGQDKLIATAKQCVALYRDFSWREADAKGKTIRKYLPDVADIVNASQANPQQQASAALMEKDFSRYAQGEVYFPGSNVPIDDALINSLSFARDGLSESNAGLLIEAYEACKLEADRRFEESYTDWKIVSDPTNVQARIEPLKRICRARFQRDEERQQRLETFIQARALLEAEIRLLDQQPVSGLPTRKALIPHSCKATIGR